MPHSGKNSHASLSPALLSRMQQAAETERLSVEEFVADAIDRRLNQRALEDVLAFGKRHARGRGLTPGDVARSIAAERTGHKARGH